MHPQGSFVLVLHGHMPWVLGHGRWPHGEQWLYEAALGVYLPLLNLVDELDAAGARAPFTLGLVPVLVEQLRSPRFVTGFRSWLDERLALARRDAADPDLRALAHHWEEHLLSMRQRFAGIDGDIVGAFAEHARVGRVELLTSLATHAYAPLLLHDASIRGQLAAGLAISEQHLGFRPGGLWLPECAFRPAGPWTPPVLHHDQRLRAGVDQLLAEQGITHFFVDAHLFAGARSEGVVEDGQFRKVDWEEATRDPGRGWRDVLEPHRVGTDGGMSEVVAFARHPRVSEQVWSGQVGYPGDPRYLEFHKKHGDNGLRYWRVTGRDVDLGAKQRYDPAAVAGACYEHAQHFAHTVSGILSDYRRRTGRDGCLVAPFDAELFGHWWHEGPRFLRDVLLTLHADPAVRVQSAFERRFSHPPDKVAWLPEGSWGEGGDHRVWFRDEYRWVWETAYRAEDRFLGLRWRVSRAPARRRRRAERWLRRAARELLLLQSSDWPFVITTGGAVDYGWQRICGHQEGYDRCCMAVEDALAGRPTDPLLAAWLRVQERQHAWQTEVDPGWWRE
ncbi:MAG: DUF1957 domain-containing protein [Deltaproteobacteria bacterium]|nr:MAG: DUF1957 domain-containing protein [Deltaproteobacteria bacterium]